MKFKIVVKEIVELAYEVEASNEDEAYELYLSGHANDAGCFLADMEVLDIYEI